MPGPINPFRPVGNARQKMANQAPAANPPAPPSIKGLRGQTGEERASVLSAMSQDVSVRATRIHYLKTLGQTIYDELQDGQEIGSSRLAWLQKQLSQKDL